MYYFRETTQTPNVLFDIHLKTLSKSELKVLLTVIRKTVGIVHPDNPYRRVERAWISQNLFMLCTGLSGRAVSSAIDSLVTRHLITVTNSEGYPLKTKTSRRGVFKLFYSSSLLLGQGKAKSSELSCNNPVTKGHTIKLIDIKQSCEKRSQGTKGIRKLSDGERIEQIMQHFQK